MARKIVIDCDPGQDDAVALLLAMSSPDELNILGVTTVAGNVPLELTERNARIVTEIAQRTDVAVYGGCDQPMVRDLVTAENVHGNTGIDGVEIYDDFFGCHAQAGQNVSRSPASAALIKLDNDPAATARNVVAARFPAPW